MKKAISIAQAALRKYVTDQSQWRLNQITLRSIGKQPKWYYVVEWRPTWEGYMGDGIGIPVLMSGETVSLEAEVDADGINSRPPKEGAAWVLGGSGTRAGRPTAIEFWHDVSMGVYRDLQ